MKKLILIAAIMGISLSAGAQKVAYVNTETILAAIPQYQSAQKQLEAQNSIWQKEVEDGLAQLDRMFASYQTDKTGLNPAQRRQREQAIIDYENQVKALKEKYFGQEGLMSARSREVLEPIMEKVQQAIDVVAERENCALVLDVASGSGIMYQNPLWNLSNKVLEVLGYKK